MQTGNHIRLIRGDQIYFMIRDIWWPARLLQGGRFPELALWAVKYINSIYLFLDYVEIKRHFQPYRKRLLLGTDKWAGFMWHNFCTQIMMYLCWAWTICWFNRTSLPFWKKKKTKFFVNISHSSSRCIHP